MNFIYVLSLSILILSDVSVLCYILHYMCLYCKYRLLSSKSLICPSGSTYRNSFAWNVKQSIWGTFFDSLNSPSCLHCYAANQRPMRSPQFKGGRKPIFKDLYVYIFVLLKIICLIWAHLIYVLKHWKNKITTIFWALQDCLKGPFKRRGEVPPYVRALVTVTASRNSGGRDRTASLSLLVLNKRILRKKV